MVTQEFVDRLTELEKTVEFCKNRCKECTGGILSSADYRRMVVHAEKKDAEGKLINYREIVKQFEDRDWEKVGDRIIIDPYDELNLTPFSYDLSVGREIVSLRPPVPLRRPTPCQIEPGETVTVLTREFVALPPTYAATVWPRFKLVQEGIFQSMVKIDPTWYGRLAVVVTNLSPRTFELVEDMAFGTLIVFGLSSPTDINLWPLKEVKDEAVSVDVSKVSGLERISQALGSFEGVAWLHGTDLRVAALKQSDYTKLLKLDASDPWKKAVTDARELWLAKEKRGRKIIGMKGVGMHHLDDITRGPSDGKPPDFKALERDGVTREKLRCAAEEHGKPFDLVAMLPDTVVSEIEKHAFPRMEAQIEDRIQPRVITLMFAVLGFLTLIVSALALSLRFGTTDLIQLVATRPAFSVVMIVVASVTIFALIGLAVQHMRMHKRGSP
jgi:deoxycytidine triphosphate deaminase